MFVQFKHLDKNSDHRIAFSEFKQAHTDIGIAAKTDEELKAEFDKVFSECYRDSYSCSSIQTRGASSCLMNSAHIWQDRRNEYITLQTAPFVPSTSFFILQQITSYSINKVGIFEAYPINRTGESELKTSKPKWSKAVLRIVRDSSNNNSYSLHTTPVPNVESL